MHPDREKLDKPTNLTLALKRRIRNLSQLIEEEERSSSRSETRLEQLKAKLKQAETEMFGESGVNSLKMRRQK